MCCSAVFIRLCSLTSPECLSLWIQHWNFLVICLALTYNGTLLIIRELLLEPYIILNGFLAWWRIHFGRVLTPAFIPSLLLDEGHSLYLQNDFPLFSFIPAFLPSSTPGHESENLTPQRGEKRRREQQREKRDKLREKEGAMGTVGRKREELIDISEKQVTWDNMDWPCYLEVQDTV